MDPNWGIISYYSIYFEKWKCPFGIQGFNVLCGTISKNLLLRSRIDEHRNYCTFPVKNSTNASKYCTAIEYSSFLWLEKHISRKVMKIISSAYVSTCIYMCVVYIYIPIFITFTAYFFLNFEIGSQFPLLAWNSQRFACLCIPNTETKGLCHHAWQFMFLVKDSQEKIVPTVSSASWWFYSIHYQTQALLSVLVKDL